MPPIPQAKDAPPSVATPSAKTPLPSPPQKENATTAGSGFGPGVTRLPDVKPSPAPPPLPATTPSIPTTSLQTDDDARYFEKLNALLADNSFKQLPADDAATLLLYLTDHHDAIDPLIDKLARERDEEAFELRKQEIDRWLSKSGNTAAERIVVALEGSSELKSLSKRGQMYLIYHAATPGETHIDFDDVCKLTLLVHADHKLRKIVAEGLFNLAVEMQERPEDDRDSPHGQARAFAFEALNAMRDDERGLGEMISHKPPPEAAAFARALGSEHMRFPGRASNARSQLLSALNSQPSTEATLAVMGTLFAITSSRDVAAATPQLARNLAIALARETYPDPGDAKKAVAEAKRLEGLMSADIELIFGGSLDRKVNALAALRSDTSITARILSDYRGDQTKNPVIAKAMAQVLVPVDAPGRAEVIARFSKILQEDQGQQLVFGTRSGQAEDDVPGAAKNAALQIIFTHPITAETLRRTDDPWVNPAIVEPIAQQLAANYRTDEPTVLIGATLENMVGKAMGFPTNLPAEISEEQALEGIETGTLSVYAPQNNYRTIKDYETIENYRSIEKIADQLRRVGGSSPRVTVLPVIFLGMDRGPRPRGPFPGGPIQLPLFCVQTAAGDKFVDNLGYCYDNFDDWKKHNRLPPGLVIFPENGHLQIVHSHLQTGQDESLILGHLTKPSETAGEMVDSLALVGGIVAGGLVILGTGGLAAAALLGTTAWGTYRSGNELYFNYTHGDPLSTSEKRALWLSFAANATGVVPGAAELALARYIAKGSQIGRGFALTLGAFGTLATVANGASLANDVVELFQKWGPMTTEDRISGILNIAYTGLIGGVGARHAIKFFHPVKAAAAVLARSRQARLARLETRLNELTGQFKTASPEQIAKINEDIDKVQTAIQAATQINPAEKKLLDRLDPPDNAATKFDPDNFWPNPKAPNGPVRSKHDSIAHAIGGLVARARAAGKLLRKSADPVETYKILYDKASPEHRKFLPAPGSFRVDDNTVALAEFVGGLERLVVDIHAHQTGYDGRIPWNDPILLLKHGTDALVNLIRSAGKNARVVAAGVPMLCGAYYADAYPAGLTLRYAMALDRRFAEVYLKLFRQGPDGQAEAAKVTISMTGFDFSEMSTQDPVVYIVSMWKKYPGVFSFFGELTFAKEMVGQALGAHKSSLSNPKFLSMLRWLVKENIKVPIEVHNDMGHPDLDEAGRAAAIKMAYENVPELISVFGAKEFRGLNVILAHTGIGRYLRPNDKPVIVSVIDRATGKRIVRQVPEHIAEMYHVAEMIPNASFDLSWNDVTQAYADNQELKKALVDFIVDNQDRIRILYGSDTVKPANTGHYNQGLYTGAPIFAEVARRDPEALWKILRSNAEKLLDEGEASVADWTHRNLADPKALAAMDDRNKILAEHHARMLRDARADFDNWIAKFRALDKPFQSGNPGVFPTLYRLLPDAHDHAPPLQGANPAYGPVGRGTPGGYVNEPPAANPIARQAVRNNKIAVAGITAAAGAGGAVAIGQIGDHADALAFMGRGAAIAVRALYSEKLRLDWEEIFEEGHVTRDNLNAFVSRIFDAAAPLKITDEKKLYIAAATEQFFANYETLAAQPPESYGSIGGTPEEARIQRFNVIMAKVGEYQIAVDRILGLQASSINPLDARTTLGKMYRGFTLATYLVNDVAAVEWLTNGQLDWSKLSTPEGKAEAAFHILFALGNAGKTAEGIAGLSGGLSGRLNETNPFFRNVLQKYSNWALTLGGAAWTANDFMAAYNKVSAGRLTLQSGLDTVKVMLDLAFTYGVYRMSDFEAAKAAGKPLPHVRNLAWATAVVGGALVLREIIRELEEKKRESGKSANGAPAASPATAPAAAEH